MKVKVRYGEEVFEEVFEVEADTTEELKEKISRELIQEDEDDDLGVGEDWRLYQFGFVLPNAPETKLEDFKVDDGEIQLNLLEPKEGKRGQPRTIQNLTDKDRFIVRNWEDNIDIQEIKPKGKKPFQLKSKAHKVFYTSQKFGILTSFECDEPGKQRVKFDVYKVTRKGYVVLLKSEEDGCDVSVCLVPENSTEPSKDGVKWIDVMTYDEAQMKESTDKASRERREYMFQCMNAVLQAGATVVGGAAQGATEGAVSAQFD